MKGFIITEGGVKGGLGHIQRCLAIAHAFKESGMALKFLINGDKSIKPIIHGQAHEIFDWQQQSNGLLQKIKGSDVVIVDSYMASVGLCRKIVECSKVVAWMDDNNRIRYPRGIIINSGLHAHTLNYVVTDGQRSLLGHAYACLRKPFWQVPTKVIEKKIKKVMITTGGCDPLNLTPRVLKHLVEHYPLVEKQVIIGSSFDHVSVIKSVADHRTKLRFSPSAQMMKRIMLASDVAISAGGQTIYELARLGVPTIAFCMAENQRQVLDAWTKKRFIVKVGNLKNLERGILLGLKKLNMPQERIKRGKIGSSLIDGQGARRIREEILKYEN